MEEWRPVVGYQGIYEVSDHGNVRSLDRIDYKGTRKWGRVLTPDVRPTGHLRVTLARDGGVRRYWVHHLVLNAFVGVAPSADLQTCHNDGNPQNNTPSNLRWDTASANARDRRLHGTDHHARKTHCSRGHAYDAANTYVTKQGARVCRTCHLAHDRRRYRANQEKTA